MTATPCILIVDDEPAIADAVRFSLQQHGYNSVVAGLAQDAIVLAERHCFVLAILDVGLPDMDGFELCKQLQRQRHLPVIFLTARNAEIDRVVGLEIGADDYVCKPFSPRELMARVKIVLKRHTATLTTSLAIPVKRLADFSWDERARSMVWKGQALQLTRYEYDILLLLLKEPGRIFSRDDIMSRVWVAPEHSLDRTVDTHIKTLRAKLRAVDPSCEAVLTHRGLGYSLNSTRSSSGTRE
jgi:two-component system catabolic regulation response regulator CreB